MKIFYIVSIIFFVNVSAKGQDRTIPSADNVPNSKIVKFYPNPATTFINFEFQQSVDKTSSLQIFNFLGKKVYELNNISNRTYIDLTSFLRGIYIFQLRDRTGKVIESGKFNVSK